jgi:hypothetical protein
VTDGVEVVVMAWRPRGSAGTRYRVRGDDGADGWLHAANLRTTLAAPPPALEPVDRGAVPAPAPRRFGERP